MNQISLTCIVTAAPIYSCLADKSYIKEAILKGWYAPYQSLLLASEKPSSLWHLAESIDKGGSGHSEAQVKYLTAFTISIHPDFSHDLKCQAISQLVSEHLKLFKAISKANLPVFASIFSFLSQNLAEILLKSFFEESQEYHEVFYNYVTQVLRESPSDDVANLLPEMLLSLPEYFQDEVWYYFKLHASAEMMEECFKRVPLFKSFDETLKLEIDQSISRFLKNDRQLERSKPYRRLYMIHQMVELHYQSKDIVLGLNKIEREDWENVIDHLNRLSCDVKKILIQWLKNSIALDAENSEVKKQEGVFLIEKILQSLVEVNGLYDLAEQDYVFMVRSMDEKGLRKHLNSSLPDIYKKNFISHLVHNDQEKFLRFYRMEIKGPALQQIDKMVVWSRNLSFICKQVQKVFFEANQQDASLNLHYFISLDKQEKREVLRDLALCQRGQNLLNEWMKLCLPSNKGLNENIKQLFVADFGYLCFQERIDLKAIMSCFALENPKDQKFLDTKILKGDLFISNENLQIFGLKLLACHYACPKLDFSTRHRFTKVILDLYLKNMERQVLIDTLFLKLKPKSRSLAIIHLLQENDFYSLVESRNKNLEHVVQCMVDLLKSKKHSKDQEVFSKLSQWAEDNVIALSLVEHLLKKNKSYRYFFDFLENLPLKDSRKLALVSLMIEADERKRYLTKAFLHARKFPVQSIEHFFNSEYAILAKEAKKYHSAQGVYYFFDWKNSKGGIKLIQAFISKDRNSARDFLEANFAAWCREITLLNETALNKLELFQCLSSILIDLNCDVFKRIDQLPPSQYKVFQEMYRNIELTRQIPFMDHALLDLISYFDPVHIAHHALEHFKGWFDEEEIEEREKVLALLMVYLETFEANIGSVDPLLELVKKDKKLRRIFIKGFKEEFFAMVQDFPELSLKVVRFFRQDWQRWIKRRIERELQAQEWDENGRLVRLNVSSMKKLFLQLKARGEWAGFYQDCLSFIEEKSSKPFYAKVNGI